MSSARRRPPPDLPGSPAHLVRRFFDVATAAPLNGSERAAIEEWLAPELAEIFFQQPDHDQRHGYHAALCVIAGGIADPDVVCAALVHDVGKRHARLGLVGRSIASLLILIGIDPPERVRLYRDHGVVGARELAGALAPSVAIDFAIHHHGDRPASIDMATWDVLVAADQPPKTSVWEGRRITSAPK